MVVGRRRVPRSTLRETWRSPSMRDNYRSPAFFPVPHVSLRNFPQFFNQSSWFEEESSKDDPVSFSFLHLRFLKKQSLATGAIVRARHAIYRRATIFHASWPMVNTRYLRMQTYRHTRCATFTQCARKFAAAIALRFVALRRAISCNRGAIKGDVTES